MTKRQPKRQSNFERIKMLSRPQNQTGPEVIATAFNRGDMNIRTARAKLERTTAKGMLWSGELALQQAYQAQGKPERLRCLDSAQDMFTRSRQIGNYASQKTVSPVSARAEVQAALLPIHARVVLEGHLPTKVAAEKAYERTLAVGQAVSLEHRANDDNPNRKLVGELKGAVAEIAVLGLLERAAIQKIGSETWFPFLSHFSQEHGNHHGSSLNHGWNVNILTAPDADTSAALAYRIQVKSSNYAHPDRQERSYGDDIALVCVDPDLKLSPSEHNIAHHIISDSFSELTEPNQSLLTVRRLDERTDLLLELIDG